MTLLIMIIVVLAAALGVAIALHLQVSRVLRHLRMWNNRFNRDLIAATIVAGPRYRDPRHLSHFEGQVYSQHGEDGILSEIFRRIGDTNKRFVEIAAGDGEENNTRYRLDQGWSG